MIRPIIIILTCIATLGVSDLFVGKACAQVSSLFERRDGRMSDLFADVKARRPGDLLFVMIQEQSDVENKDRRQLNKQNSSSMDAGGTYGLGGGLGTAAGNLSYEQDSAAARSFNGNTQYKSEREFLDRFTVMVVDTLPNGNLLISGSRSVALEGDNRKLVLTGLVRSVDVSTDNTISSRLVSNLMIRYEAADDGAEARFVNQGWLGKKLNRVWPF